MDDYRQREGFGQRAPMTDEEAIERILALWPNQAGYAQSLVLIFRCNRGMGKTVLEAFKEVLLATLPDEELESAVDADAQRALERRRATKGGGA